MYDKECFDRFAKNLKALRENSQLSRSQVATALGLHRETYTAYENGAMPPSFKALISISEYYNLQISDLLIYEPERILMYKEFFDSQNAEIKVFIKNYQNLSLFSKGRLVESAAELYLKEHHLNL